MSKKNDPGAAIFDFIQYAVDELKYKPDDIAIGLIHAYLAVLVTYAETKDIPELIAKACDFLKSARVVHDGQIHCGNGEIH